MKKGILIQARLSSSRLPKKMLMDLGEYKLVEFIYRRCSKSTESDMCAIITSTDSSDDELYDFCIKKDITVFRGGLENVLQRYIDASEFFNLDIVSRVCGDSPFVNIEYIDAMLKEQEEKNLDYIGFNKDTIIHGLDSEVIKKDILKNLLNYQLSNNDKEHVTFFIKNNLNKFDHKLIQSDFTFEEIEKIRFTVDYMDDLLLCRKYYLNNFDFFDITLDNIKNAIAKES